MQGRAPHRCPDRCGLGKPQERTDRQLTRARIPGHDAGASALPRLLARILLVHHERPAATPHTIEPGRTFSPRSEFLTFMI